MFDTMTLTKAVAAICGAWLILLLGNWAASGLYKVGGHGEPSFVVEVASDESGDQEEAVEVSFDEVYAAADAGSGEKLFRACQSCHKLEDGKNATGPYLYGVVGREIGAVEGYGYSDAIAGLGGAWTPEELSHFLENPKEYAPGTKMSYKGMGKIEDRANLIAYLETIGG